MLMAVCCCQIKSTSFLVSRCPYANCCLVELLDNIHYKPINNSHSQDRKTNVLVLELHVCAKGNKLGPRLTRI